MTITLDYSGLQLDDDRVVLEATEGDVHYEVLLARTVFRVDDADFSIHDEKVPLLDFSLVLLTLAAALADGAQVDYESPVSWLKIRFARSGETVRLGSNFTHATTTVGLSELRDATAAFHERVIHDLVIRYPTLAKVRFVIPSSHAAPRPTRCPGHSGSLDCRSGPWRPGEVARRVLSRT
jgi:hypothetical protein